MSVVQYAALSSLATDLLEVIGGCGPGAMASGEGAADEFAIPGLSFPDGPNFVGAFVAQGCSAKCAEQLDGLLQITCFKLQTVCRAHFLETATRTAKTFAEDADERTRWMSALQETFCKRYLLEVESFAANVLDEIRAAQLRHSTSPPPPPPPPASDAATTTLAGHFTPAITALLQSAYDARATGALPNKGERRELARATGLSEKQVVTWVSARV